MLLKGNLLSFIFILFTCFLGRSQTSNYLFKSLNTDNGLVHNHVNCSIRDKFNYLWFGTESGLSRFDGVNFTNFRSSNTKKDGLSNNFVNALFEGPEGNIWIRTNSKMNVFEHSSGRIINNVDSILKALKVPVKEVYSVHKISSSFFGILYADRTLVVGDVIHKKYRTVSVPSNYYITDFWQVKTGH